MLEAPHISLQTLCDASAVLEMCAPGRVLPVGTCRHVALQRFTTSSDALWLLLAATM
jgi:hypothetical protein